MPGAKKIRLLPVRLPVHTRAFLVLGVSLSRALPLWADSSKEEKKLQHMQAERATDGKHRSDVENEMNINVEELTKNESQQKVNVDELQSTEAQLIPAQERKKRADQSYKDAVKKYGPYHPHSTRAKKDLEDARKSESTLQQSRRELKMDVHDGGRLVHNERAVIGLQKQVISSDSRYIAADDKNIAVKKQDIQEKKQKDLTSDSAK